MSSIGYRQALALEDILASQGASTNTAVGSGTAAFANLATAGTVVNIDMPLPSKLQRGSSYVVTVYNPSTETALTVRPQNVVTLGGGSRYSQVGDDLTVPANSTRSFVVDGWFIGDSVRLEISNVTALGAAGAFTAAAEVRTA